MTELRPGVVCVCAHQLFRVKAKNAAESGNSAANDVDDSTMHSGKI